MNACPSELQLELQWSHLSPEMETHLASCTRCAARIAELRQREDEFRRFVFPATRQAVVEGVQRGRRNAWMWRAGVGLVFALSIPLATAQTMKLWAAQEGVTGISGEQTKGGVGLGVYLRTDAGAKRVSDAQKVPAAAALRFRVQLPKACEVTVVSYDAEGKLSTLAASSRWPAGMHELPGGAVLDGVPGPERIFVLCSLQPVDLSLVERALPRERGAGAVRTLRHLEAGAELQETILLEKVLP